MIEFIYAFGSICRGEIDKYSDIDILVVTEASSIQEYPSNYSYYKKMTLKKLWEEGNPFAWHLYSEAKLLFSLKSKDYIKELGKPSKYKNMKKDIKYLLKIFEEAKSSIEFDFSSLTYDLSIVFLVIRNVATCYELGVNQRFCFSRDSAIEIGDNKLKIPLSDYNTLKSCRLLSTRGVGKMPTKSEFKSVIDQLPRLEKWIMLIESKIEDYESVQK